MRAAQAICIGVTQKNKSLEKQGAFLQDFGLVEAAQTDNDLYMRGYGNAPYVYMARKGSSARFLGAGFLVDSEEDLQRIAGRSSDYREGVNAFLQKREPEFKGR